MSESQNPEPKVAPAPLQSEKKRTVGEVTAEYWKVAAVVGDTYLRMKILEAELDQGGKHMYELSREKQAIRALDSTLSQVTPVPTPKESA